MQFKRHIAFVAVTLAGASFAQTPESRPQLWKDLHIGMSKEEVEKLYPSKTVVLSASCPAKLKPVYLQERLTQIVLFIQTGVQCTQTISSSLTEKYGAPVGTDETVHAGAMSVSNSDNIYWRNKSILISLRIRRLGGMGTLVYRYFADQKTESASENL